jgi:gamma-glutamylcyclotransferase (GGCT)/AIG2-like uncharacterized protein YtfP
MKVAVYGTLRKGFSNNRLLNDSDYLGTDILTGFEMYSLGAFPAIKSGNGEIEVEVYEINPHTLNALDMLEGYLDKYSPFNMYNRESVQTKYGEAYVYIWAKSLTGRTKIPSGKWERNISIHSQRNWYEEDFYK